MKRIFRIAFIISILTIILSGCSKESTNEFTTKPQGNLGKTEYNTMVYNTLTSNEQIVYDQMLTGFQNTESPIAVSGTEAEIETAYDAIIADRPDIFYVEGYVYDTQTTVLSKEVAKEGNIYPNYTCSVDEYRQYLIRIHETMDTWFHDINQMTNDYEKSKYIFTELAKHNTYNKNANQGFLSLLLKFSIDSVFPHNYDQADQCSKCKANLLF